MSRKHILRRLFEKNITDTVGSGNKIALLLSSGLDGLVSGLAAQDAGNEIHAFTFQMGDNESFDSKHARIVAEKLGWDFTLIKVPTSVSTIKKFWRKAHKEYECIKKRDYECAYPMYYCYKAIAKHGYKHVLSGLRADGYFLYTRKTHIAGISGHKSDRTKYDAHRREHWMPWYNKGKHSLGVDGYNPSGELQHLLMCDEFGLTPINPWLQKPVLNYFLKYSWAELNSPKQKMPIREAWSDYIDIVGHRPHRGYQTEAKVPMYFEQLLDDNDINFNGRKRIMDVARDWSKLDNVKKKKRKYIFGDSDD